MGTTATAAATTAAKRTRYLDPVPDEIEARELPVQGALPLELCGRYLRNGPNSLPGDLPGHRFTGHGMVHGIRLRAGRVPVRACADEDGEGDVAVRRQ